MPFATNCSANQMLSGTPGAKRIVGLVMSVLPALEAHTRLLLGRYLEYRVTEKV